MAEVASGAGERPRVSKWGKRLAIALAGFVVVIVVAAGVVFALSSSRINATHEVEVAPVAVKPDPSMVERGKEIATFRGCRDCHGEDLAGKLVADAMPVMKLAGPNITPGGVTANYGDEDWARTIRHGVKPNGKSVLFMPSFEYTALSHADMAALIAYAKSVPPVDGPGPAFELGPLGRVLFLAGELPLLPAEIADHGIKPADPTPGPTAEYGAYLATGCTGCHGPGYSGGPIPGVPPDWPAAANLTQHESGLKGKTFEDFSRYLREGVNSKGEKMNPQYMPWTMISESSEDDLRALWAYLQTKEPKPKGNR